MKNELLLAEKENHLKQIKNLEDIIKKLQETCEELSMKQQQSVAEYADTVRNMKVNNLCMHLK